MAKTEKMEILSGVLRIRGAEERLEQAKKSDQGEISGDSSVQFSSVTQSCLVTPWAAACQASLSFTISGACSNSCPSSRWCHPTISSSVVPFSCLQSFPASGSFQMSLFFTSYGQGIGVSASVSVLPMNIQDWFPLG